MNPCLLSWRYCGAQFSRQRTTVALHESRRPHSGASVAAVRFITFRLRRSVAHTGVDSTLQVLLRSTSNGTFWPAAERLELPEFAVQSNGESSEMNVLYQTSGIASCGPAHPAASRVRIRPGHCTASCLGARNLCSAKRQDRGGGELAEPGPSQTGKSCAAERSHSPKKRVAREILHSEGNATRFIGLRNRTPWT